MAGLWTLIIIGSIIYFFWLNRKVAEAANLHAQRQIEQLNVQLMSVACNKRRIGILKSGKPYRSPLDFYIKNGFKVLPEIRLELPSISAVKIKWSSDMD